MKMNKIEEEKFRKMKEAHGRLHQAKTHVKDLQQIYDTVNGSLYLAKLQLDVYEEQNQKAIDEYVLTNPTNPASLGVIDE